MTLHRIDGKDVPPAGVERRSTRPAAALLRRVVATALVALTPMSGTPAEGGPGDAVESVEVDGETSWVRTIRVTEGAGSSALIVGLHGYGMDERQMRTLVDVAPTRPHRYVSVRGFETLDDGGHAWFPVTLVEGRAAWSGETLREAIDRLSRLVARLAARFEVELENVYLVGYSQGGSMALATALVAPESAGGFVGFAGSVPSGLARFAADGPSPRPVLIGHGTRDELISSADIVSSVEALEAIGHRVELASFDAPHVVSAAGRRRIADWLDERLADRP